jgi:polyhydroxybutyrate depolymerase
LADSAKFVVAYPDGVGRAWNVNGGCCGRRGRQNIDDVGFVTAVVGDIAANVNVDPHRRYATGISNGGMLAYALACNTGTFAAIGPDSATQLDKCAAPHPTSVMHIHGTADPRIRYDGGPGSGAATPDGGPSMPDLNAFWRNVDGCAPPATTTDGAITTSTAGCPDGRNVVLVTVDGGGHEWPPFATQSLWQFFAAHEQFVRRERPQNAGSWRRVASNGRSRRTITSVVQLSEKCNMKACQTRMSSPTRSRRWRTTTPRHHRY